MGGGGELASPLHVRPVKLLCDKFKDSLIKIGKNEISRKSKKSSLRLKLIECMYINLLSDCRFNFPAPN